MTLPRALSVLAVLHDTHFWVCCAPGAITVVLSETAWSAKVSMIMMAHETAAHKSPVGRPKTWDAAHMASGKSELQALVFGSVYAAIVHTSSCR